MNIVFFGTPEFGATILEKLIQAQQKPSLAVTTPDEPVGRKKLLTPPPVKVTAEKHDIPVLQPDILDRDVASKLQDVKPDLLILASYGRIIPKEILALAQKGAMNVHPSLLPLYRGPSPVQSVILEGEEKTGVTIILMDEDIDHGPIIAQQELAEPIGKMTQEELKEKLADVGGDLLVKVVPKWLSGDIVPQPQNHELATFTKKVTKEDGRIDWNKEAEYIARQIRGLYPWPGTFTTWNKKTLKILRGKTEEIPSEHSSTPPGTTIPWQEGFSVMTAKGVLVVEQVQPEGGKPMPAKDFLLGHKDFLGTVLN